MIDSFDHVIGKLGGKNWKDLTTDALVILMTGTIYSKLFNRKLRLNSIIIMGTVSILCKDCQ
jgi:hypothetical protein